MQSLEDTDIKDSRDNKDNAETKGVLVVLAVLYVLASASGCPQLQLRLQTPAELGGVEEQARLVRRGEEGCAQAVLYQEREEVIEKVVQGDRRRLGALPVAAGAGAGQLGVGPERE